MGFKFNIKLLSPKLLIKIYVVCVFCFCYLLNSHGAQVAAFKDHRLPPKVSQQPYRTAYHFQPPKNWMNDPNGPMSYKGVYHFFYQYNPYGPLWGNISWGHAISYDLINWVHVDIALSPNKPYDINGCFSGSTTILPNGEPAILYTGVDTNGHQATNLAFPRNVSDPLLNVWVKSPRNPILSPPDGVDPEMYRDPSTGWLGPDGEWRFVIGSQVDNQGSAILYKSKDFSTWVRSSSPLHFSNKTKMWECPDFYPVVVDGKKGLDASAQGKNIKHVLKASFNNSDYYVLGNYDPKTDQYDTDVDFLDSKASFRGWSGLQTIPRSIWLSKSGDQLVQWPVKELEKLRTQKVHFENKELKGGSMIEISGITASQADVEIAFSLSNLEEAEQLSAEVVDPQILCRQKNASTSGKFGPFGLLVLASKDLNEHTAVFFRVFKTADSFRVLMCADQSRSSVRPKVDKSIYGAFLALDPRNEKISLRTLIDHSIVESFGGGGLVCITARVYPEMAVEENAHLYAFNNGSQSLSISSLSGWSMKKAQVVSIRKRRKPIK
ncbi:hypothetical protein SSX86_006041 [Deinandra increscens subsp. villosa]|uniref:Uncharacterized protein n=1 Tax=Deinandra increscens subsp. villosa TaxID=3103831 RepID=A0AAP0DMN8_9ASTR